jgi:hypothetical protein
MRLTFRPHFATLLLLVALLAAGCGTAQRNAYRTAYTTAVSVDAAMSAWGDYVAEFHPPASEEAKVKAAYERYRASMLVVADAGKAWAEGTGSQARLDLAIATAAGSLGDVLDLVRKFGVNIPGEKP